MDHPFIFDVIKSETVDWEQNDTLYRYGPQADNDPAIGYLSGYLSDFVSKCSTLCQFRNSQDIVFLPGRMNFEHLKKLML